MPLLTKTNALFFYVTGIFFLVLTYFFMEPFSNNGKAAASLVSGISDSLVAYIKIFYALGFFFIVFGAFMFFVSGLYPEQRKGFF